MSDINAKPTPLRQFNAIGIDRFRAWLRAARLDPLEPASWNLLGDPEATEPVQPETLLGRPGFASKRQAAAYLHERLSAVNPADVLRNAGLWTWLTLFYLDDVCPPLDRGRSVKADYYYVYEPDQGLYHYRHLLRISYEVMRRSPDHNRLLLESPLDRLGSVTEKVMRRLFLTRIDAIFEVMDRLYFDRDKGRPKRGIADPRPRPGDLVNRLPRRVQQLQRTFDLNVVDAERLIQLLGPEFQQWQQQPDLPGISSAKHTG